MRLVTCCLPCKHYCLPACLNATFTKQRFGSCFILSDSIAKKLKNTFNTTVFISVFALGSKSYWTFQVSQQRLYINFHKHPLHWRRVKWKLVQAKLA